MMVQRIVGRGRRGRWFAFVAIQIVAVLVLLEIVLRIAGPQFGMRTLLYLPGSASHYDIATSLENLMDRSVLGFSPYEDHYGFVLNSRSMRTKEYDDLPAANTQRVLAFGDSFTFASGGLPHADHWTTILESELERSGSVEVLRLGVPGTGPRFQHRLWQLEGSRLGAHVVVHAFFVGNDFFDHQGTPTLSPIEDADPGDILAGRWLTYRAVRNLRRVARGTEKSAERQSSSVPRGERGGYAVVNQANRRDPERPSFTRDEFIAIEARRMALCLRDDEALFARVLDAVGDTLTTFGREVESTGARYIVMLIPDEYQVDPSVRSDAMAAAGTTLDDYDLFRPQRMLSRRLEEQNIQVLDLSPFFVEAGRLQHLYNLRDTHWNREGNHLAAQLLAAYLEGRGLDEATVDRVPLFDDGVDEGTTKEWSHNGG